MENDCNNERRSVCLAMCMSACKQITQENMYTYVPICLTGILSMMTFTSMCMHTIYAQLVHVLRTIFNSTMHTHTLTIPNSIQRLVETCQITFISDDSPFTNSHFINYQHSIVVFVL